MFVRHVDAACWLGRIRDGLACLFAVYLLDRVSLVGSDPCSASVYLEACLVTFICDSCDVVVRRLQVLHERRNESLLDVAEAVGTNFDSLRTCCVPEYAAEGL